jgi:iron complex outermembrane receptor protein
LLYGSDALGGVLYFVGERYAQANSVEGTVNSEFSGNSLGFKNNGTFKLSKNRFHWNLFGGYVTHADYADGNGYFVPNSRFNTSNLKTGLGYTGEKYNTSLKYSYLNEKYGLTETDESEGEAYQNGRTPALPFQDLNTHIISSENTYFFENDSKLKIDAGYVFNNRKEFEDADEAALNMNLHTVSYNAGWYSPMWNERWTLTAGSQGMAQINVDRGEEILIPDAQTTDFGLFAVSNFHYSQKAYWQAGIRFDTRHISSESFENQYHSFNFSTGIYQPVMENLSFRINLSSGFRAPNMYELLTDGIHHGTNRYETGNRDLKTENSYQIDASLNYKSLHFELFANPYFNYILNYIGLNPSNEMIDNLPVFNYIQQDACLYGGEAGFHFHPHPLDWLHIEGAYSNTFGQNKQHNPLALTPSQKLNMMISASLKLKKAVEKISIYVQNKYSFAQNRVAAAETATPAYNLLNAGFSIETKYLIANLAINNVLNKVYYDHLSRYKIDGIYNAGRNFNVKITIPFSANL